MGLISGFLNCQLFSSHGPWAMQVRFVVWQWQGREAGRLLLPSHQGPPLGCQGGIPRIPRIPAECRRVTQGRK